MERNKTRFSLFRRKASEICGASVTKLVNFSLPTEAFRVKLLGEEEEEEEKLLQKPNPLIAQPAQTVENKREKTKKMCGKFSFAFLEQQSIFLILSFVVLLRRWGVSERVEKSLACFRLSTPFAVGSSHKFLFRSGEEEELSISDVGRKCAPRGLCEKHLSRRQQTRAVLRKNGNFFNSKRTTLSGFLVGNVFCCSRSIPGIDSLSEVNCCSVDHHRG